MEKARRSNQEQTIVQILQNELNVNDMTEMEKWDLIQWLFDIGRERDILLQAHEKRTTSE